MKSFAIALLIAMPLFAEAAPKHARVHAEATRLAALLSDTQGKATLTPAAWKAVGNEANALANKIYAHTGGRADAKELRMHVREMRAAAIKGDAEGAKTHAGMALPFAYKIIDWSM